MDKNPITRTETKPLTKSVVTPINPFASPQGVKQKKPKKL